MKLKLKIIVLLLLLPLTLMGQRQKDLEQRKKALLEQIKQMSALRQQQSQQHRTTIQQIEAANEKIQMRTRLIQINQQQANMLSKEIANNEKELRTLKKELEYHQGEYAKTIRQSYKSKSAENRLLFILSSESFGQAYKRLTYMKQYVNYRHDQVTQIQTKTEEIRRINDTLVVQRNEKNKVLAEQRREQALLQQEKRELEQLAVNIRQVERNYEAQIREKQKQANAIDKKIQQRIRLAIIEANRRESSKVNANTGGTAVATTPPPEEDDSTTEVAFVLTPETRRVANSFEANKGNLIWPVVKGYKSQGFGVYYDPVYPELQHYNNGVTIATERDAEARCVFEGEVSAIQSIPGSNKVVQVRHGNYITIYYNLTEVYVKKGDKVRAKEPLGKIFTNSKGKTEMKFFLYKNTTRLNPEFWIHKL